MIKKLCVNCERRHFSGLANESEAVENAHRRNLSREVEAWKIKNFASEKGLSMMFLLPEVEEGRK